MAVIDCCQHVRDLWVGGSFMAPIAMRFHGAPAYTTDKRLRLDFTPSSPQKAIARSRAWLSTLPSASCASSSDQLLPSPSTATPLDSVCAVRILKLHSTLIDGSGFLAMTRKYSLLEELTIGASIGMRADSWKDFTVGCKGLRVLLLENIFAPSYLPTIPTLLSMSPNLRTIHVNNVMFRDDQQLLNFMEPDQGSLQPHWSSQLLHIKICDSSLLEPLKALVGALTLHSGLESIVFGLGRTPPGCARPVVHVDLFEKPWLCLDSLTSMDVSLLPFEDNMTAWFFQQLQQLRRLQRLVVGSEQLRLLMMLSSGAGDMSWRKGEGASSPPLTITPGLFYLPTVNTLRIQDRARIVNYVPHKEYFFYEQAVFVMVSAPILSQLELSPFFIGLDRFRSMYPWIGIRKVKELY